MYCGDFGLLTTERIFSTDASPTHQLRTTGVVLKSSSPSMPRYSCLSVNTSVILNWVFFSIFRFHGFEQHSACSCHSQLLLKFFTFFFFNLGFLQFPPNFNKPFLKKQNSHFHFTLKTLVLSKLLLNVLIFFFSFLKILFSIYHHLSNAL